MSDARAAMVEEAVGMAAVDGGPVLARGATGSGRRDGIRPAVKAHPAENRPA